LGLKVKLAIFHPISDFYFRSFLKVLDNVLVCVDADDNADCYAPGTILGTPGQLQVRLTFIKG